MNGRTQKEIQYQKVDSLLVKADDRCAHLETAVIKNGGSEEDAVLAQTALASCRVNQFRLETSSKLKLVESVTRKKIDEGKSVIGLGDTPGGDAVVIGFFIMFAVMASFMLKAGRGGKVARSFGQIIFGEVGEHAKDFKEEFDCFKTIFYRLSKPSTVTEFWRRPFQSVYLRGLWLCHRSVIEDLLKKGETPLWWKDRDQDELFLEISSSEDDEKKLGE